MITRFHAVARANGKLPRYSVTLPAGPPSEVSLYLPCMSGPVWRIVAIFLIRRRSQTLIESAYQAESRSAKASNPST